MGGGLWLGGQSGCERRIEVFVEKSNQKIVFFWGGSGGGGVGGGVGGSVGGVWFGGGGGASGWM